MITRVAIESDIDEILELQSRNLYTNLSEAERTEGFVTTPFTVEQIKALLSQTGVFVAEKEECVVGYAFAGNWDFFSRWAIFHTWSPDFRNSNFKGLKSLLLTPSSMVQSALIKLCGAAAFFLSCLRPCVLAFLLGFRSASHLLIKRILVHWQLTPKSLI
jgi:hypothetical protein